MAKRRTWWGNPALRQVIALTGERGWWLSGSQLDLDFANDRAFNRSTGFNGSPNSILTYTSPSRKLVYGDDGLLGYAPHNRLLQSQTFGTTWTVVRASVSSDVVTAPDGTTTADKLTEDTTASNSHYTSQSGTVASGVTYVFSVYVKAAERSWALVETISGAEDRYVYVNLSTGAAGTNNSTYTITDAGNGWWRVTVRATAGATSYNNLVLICPSNGTAAYTGDGTSGIYLWGGQVNYGPTALDYLATTSAAKYDLPIDHDPLTHAPLGVLIEEQRTNLLTYSQEFDNASWTKNESSISATNITAPDGTATAELLASNTNNAIHYLFVGSPPSITSGVTYTGSVFLKKGTGSTAPDWMQLSLSGASFGSIQYANFNLMTGEVGTVGAGATATVEDVGGGWYRCSITATATSTSGGSLLVVFTNNNDALGGVPAYADATTSNVCVWGAQLEAGAFATSYIQTGSAQVTRAADQVSIATSAFGFSTTAGTLVGEGSQPVLFNASNSLVSLHKAGLNAGRLTIYRQAAGTADGYSISTAAVGNAITGPAVVAGEVWKGALASSGSEQAFSAKGGSVGTTAIDMVTAFTEMTALTVGASHTGAGYWGGHIARLTYWNTRKDNSTLQELSA